MSPPRAFISHSHLDKPIALELATALRSKGVNAWFDTWEIAPGDSLVARVFNDGLKDCPLFVVLLSPDSVASKWVALELDVALIARLSEANTRVVPVVVRECEIPVALTPLARLDIGAGLDQVVSDLADAALGRWEARRPPIGVASPTEKSGDAELSDYAWVIANKLLALLLESGRPGWYGTADFAEGLTVTEQQFEDALEELEDLALVEVSRTLGRARPFDVGAVQPKVGLAARMALAGKIDFDIAADLKSVMVEVAAAGSIAAEDLHASTGLSLTRLHLAVDLIDQRNLAEVARYLGDDYGFAQIDATALTRRWVREHAR